MEVDEHGERRGAVRRSPNVNKKAVLRTIINIDGRPALAAADGAGPGLEAAGAHGHRGAVRRPVRRALRGAEAQVADRRRGEGQPEEGVKTALGEADDGTVGRHDARGLGHGADEDHGATTHHDHSNAARRGQ